MDGRNEAYRLVRETDEKIQALLLESPITAKTFEDWQRFARIFKRDAESTHKIIFEATNRFEEKRELPRRNYAAG